MYANGTASDKKIDDNNQIAFTHIYFLWSVWQVDEIR